VRHLRECHPLPRPLTISDALLKEGFNLFEQALQEVADTAYTLTTAAAV